VTVIDLHDTVTLPMELDTAAETAAPAAHVVVPAKAGTQFNALDSRLRGNDGGAREDGAARADGEAQADGADDIPVPAPLPAWRRALADAAAADPRGRAGVAERMGVSRVYVSRVMSGDIDPVPDKFIGRVLAALCRVECPHLGRTLAPAECRAYAARPYRALAAAEVNHWRACQRCPNKAPPEAAPTSSFGADAADRAAAAAQARARAKAAAAQASHQQPAGGV
jgi:hypothetical protein